MHYRHLTNLKTAAAYTLLEHPTQWEAVEGVPQDILHLIFRVQEILIPMDVGA